MVTDQDKFDPDAYRFLIDTRDWPSNNDKVLTDVRLGIRLYDDGGNQEGAERFTDYATDGGGSVLVTDADASDFDGLSLKLDPKFA